VPARDEYPPFTKRVWRRAVQGAHALGYGKLTIAFDPKMQIVIVTDPRGRQRLYRYAGNTHQFYRQMFLWHGVRATPYSQGMGTSLN